MAIFESTYLYTLTPGGTNQYTVNGQLLNGQASGDATDDVISVNETLPVTFTNLTALNGDYTYVGHEPNIPDYVAQGPDGNYYLFSNIELDNSVQNFNIQPEDIVVCFQAGTLIATPSGEVAVETLAIGDLVLTTDGRAVRVKWVGRQTVHKFFTPERKFAPVRIRAGALGEGVPHTDLLLTGDHAMILDGFAINASALCNGTTIAFEPMAGLPDSITYWHVETEDHEEILANGAPAESFIDYVGRRAFDNHREYLDLYGCERIIPEMRRTRVSSRRQLPGHVAERLGAVSFGARVEQDYAEMMRTLQSA